MSNIKNIEKHQWKKGQTGNPKGRPKGFPNLRDALEMSLYSDDDTQPNQIQQIVKTLIDRAKSGDMKAIEFLFKLLYPDGIHKYENEKRFELVWGTIPASKKTENEIDYYHSQSEV
jgi:hypothetical protein